MEPRSKRFGPGWKAPKRQNWSRFILENELMNDRIKRPRPSTSRRAKKSAAAPLREKRKRWVQRGRFAVEVEVDVIYPKDDPREPCLEPATVRWLDEVARRAEQGDVAFLRRAGRVFELVGSE
jgi:hypothetical protein